MASRCSARTHRAQKLVRRHGAIAAGALVLVVAAACSSTSGGPSGNASASTGASASASASGSPINVWTVDTESGTVGALYPQIGATAKAFAEWTNSHGGVNGRPLHVTVCDDQGTSTGATSCARRAVAADAVAVVGSFSIYGGLIVPILQQAKTAWFAESVAQAPPELNSSNSFPVSGSIGAITSEIGRAYQDGCKKVAAAIVSVGIPTYKPLLEGAAKAYGKSLGTVVSVPLASGDYSPEVTQALGGGTDCVVTVMGESEVSSWMPAWAQSGTHARMYAPQGSVDPVSTKGYASAANGTVISQIFPDLDSPVFKTMREALSAAHAPTSYEYDSVAGLGAWAGYTAFVNVVETIKGTVDASSFLDAASHDTAVSTSGMTPTLDFTKPWTDGPKGYLRVFNCSVSFAKLEGSKVVALSDKFQSTGDLVLGKGPLGKPVDSTSSTLKCQQ